MDTSFISQCILQGLLARIFSPLASSITSSVARSQELRARKGQRTKDKKRKTQKRSIVKKKTEKYNRLLFTKKAHVQSVHFGLWGGFDITHETLYITNSYLSDRRSRTHLSLRLRITSVPLKPGFNCRVRTHNSNRELCVKVLTSLTDLPAKSRLQLAEVLQARLKAAIDSSKTVRVEWVATPRVVLAVALVTYYRLTCNHGSISAGIFYMGQSKRLVSARTCSKVTE